MAWIIAFVGLVLTYFVSVLIFLDWTPKVRLGITTRFVNEKAGTLVLRLEIENISRVPVVREETRLQILEHSISQQKHLSEFVPFTKEYFDQTPLAEKPKRWKDPENVYTTTLFLYPGEMIPVEKLISFPDDDTFFHIGLQFKARLTLPSKLALRFWRISKYKKDLKFERWTTTAVVYPSLK